MLGDGNSNGKPEFGHCPFISQSAVVMQELPAGLVQAGKRGAAVNVINALSPCLGPGCQLWNGEEKKCSLKMAAESIVKLADRKSEST